MKRVKKSDEVVDSPASPTSDELNSPQSRPRKIRHLLDIDDLSREEILALLDLAEQYQANPPLPPLPLQGRVIGLFFFQTSTRTRLGFHAAAVRLGAGAIELDKTRHESGMSYSETPLDSFRSVAAYCDVTVLRHRKEDEFHEILSTSSVPIINGGCGVSSHPSQTLIDLYAVRRHFGKIQGLRIGLAGDLAGSRAGKSMIKALCKFAPQELRLMSPPGHEIDVGLTSRISRIEETHHFNLEGLDVLYMAGFPEGRGATLTTHDVRAPFRLDAKQASQLPAESIVLSPLPRIDEINRNVDPLPQAAYFQQSELGLYARMAALVFINPSTSSGIQRTQHRQAS